MLFLELLYEQHILFLSYKLHTSLLHFLILILSDKNGKPLCKLCKSLGYSTFTSIIYPLLLSSSKHFMNFSSNLDTFFFNLKPITGNFWNTAHPYKLLPSEYWIYGYFLFLSKLFMYLLFAFEYLCIAWHVPPLIPFSTSLTYHYLLIVLILFLSFWNKLVMLIQVLVIMYHFEHINHDIHLGF